MRPPTAAYDTRHVVYQPARLRPEQLKRGYEHQAKHFFYAAGWKKFEPLWDLVIRARRLSTMTPLLEGVLSKVTAEWLFSGRR